MSSEQNKKKAWYEHWWLFAIIAMYLLVVWKTTTFDELEGQHLQKYDRKVIDVASENGELSGTIGFKREGAFLQASYNLYLIQKFPENKKCFLCKQNPVFSRPCRSIDKYNYVAAIGKQSPIEIFAILAPVFCQDFTKPEDPVETAVSWSQAVCFSNQSQEDQTTEKFYFHGVALFESYDEIFQLDELKIFDSENFVIRDSCHEGKPGSNFEKTDVVKAVEFGEKVRSYRLVFKE